MAYIRGKVAERAIRVYWQADTKLWAASGGTVDYPEHHVICTGQTRLEVLGKIRELIGPGAMDRVTVSPKRE